MAQWPAALGSLGSSPLKSTVASRDEAHAHRGEAPSGRALSRAPVPFLPFTAMRDLAASQLPQPRLPSPPPPPLPARRPSSVAFVRQTGSVPRKEGSWAPISKAEPRAASPRAFLVISNSVLFRSERCVCLFVRRVAWPLCLPHGAATCALYWRLPIRTRLVVTVVSVPGRRPPPPGLGGSLQDD